MDEPRFGAVIFRRNFTQIDAQGGLWDGSIDLYPYCEGNPNQSKKRWTFPSGARVGFAHLDHEQTKLKYHGAQIGWLGFDELQEFSETQFFYMTSRNRSLCPVKSQIRATMNADADSWVAGFIEWWIDEKTGYPIEERGGVIRYFFRDGETIVWADTAEEIKELFAGSTGRHKIEPKSFTFIPADIYDNPILLEKDPTYLSTLMSLLPVEKERLLENNWKIRPGGGKFFMREWFKKIQHAEHGGTLVRFWDFASTEGDWRETSKKKDGPSYSAGALLRRKGDRWYIEDMINVRKGPGGVEELFKATVRKDREYAKKTGANLLVRWEVEPGSASKRESYRLSLSVADLDAEGIPPQGDKLVRARPFAIRAKAGDVYVLEEAWTDDLLRTLHHIPDSGHWDQMDALSGAYTATLDIGTYEPY